MEQNQPTLHDQIAAHFNELIEAGFEEAKVGRISANRSVTHSVNWITVATFRRTLRDQL